MGRRGEVADTRLYVEERGEPSAFPLLVFHGGPGLDHTWFGDYLDPLTEGGSYRLVLADERACGRSDRTAPYQTWTLERMAQDVSDLAASLGAIGGTPRLAIPTAPSSFSNTPSITQGRRAARSCRRALPPHAGSKKSTSSWRRSSQSSYASK